MEKVLVIGCGSIGRRHLRNLRGLGVAEIWAFDASNAQLQIAVSEDGVTPAGDLAATVSHEKFDLVLVCTPPHTHLEIARKAIGAGAHVFIEKPLANSLDGVEDLLEEAARGRRFIAVGYNLRFHRGIRLLKKAIDRGDIGAPLMIRAEVGQYLPDWRPGVDYRTGYNASAAMGGGIILDASHEIDYVRWLAGEIESVWCAAGHLSSLAIETEDAAAIIMRVKGGAIAEVHLDSIQRAYSRNCKVIGENGTLVWDYTSGLRVYSASAGQWEAIPVDADPNDMYVDEMKHVLACVRDEASPLIDGSTGRRVLEIALAARESARTHREIAL